ncbi:hypothetical protein XI00_05590 [Bradyrhizobium sp. CCBAU 21359]|nr:hypothetical protein [Bradyrhizobium sp. CCBAU 21359]
MKLRSTSLRAGFVTVIIEAWTKRSHLNGYGDNKCERAARPMRNLGPKSVRCWRDKAPVTIELSCRPLGAVELATFSLTSVLQAERTNGLFDGLI